MIIVEELEELIYQYLREPSRSNASAAKLNVQHLAGLVAHHLGDRGIDVGFTDGSRLTPTGGTARRREPQRHRLSLIMQHQHDGEVRIFCDGRDCVWSWPLHMASTARARGEIITAAVQHALLHRHMESRRHN